MKVAFLVEHLEPERGGLERSASEFLTEITSLGVEVHVVTQNASWRISGLHVHPLGIVGVTRRAQYKNFVWRAQHFLAKGSWDIIHAIRPCLGCDIYQPRAGLVRAGQERAIATRRNKITKLARWVAALLDGKERLLASLEQRLFKGPHPPVVAAPSDYVQRQLQNAYALPSHAVRQVFNGVLMGMPEHVDRGGIRGCQRKRLGLDDQALVAIFVGHNFRRKGLARVLESLTRPGGRAWRLLVVGRDSPHWYQCYANRLGVQDRVQFLGHRSDMRELYWTADACVSATYNDPCSRTVLEALSVGVPCITTSYDGASECMREGEHGFVVTSPESVDNIALALNKLADEPTRRYMSLRAIALAPYLSMRRHASEMIRLYEEILRTRGHDGSSGRPVLT